MTLIIGGQLPNLNDYTRACRTNRFAGAEMKKRCEKIISYEIWRSKLQPVTGTVMLRFRWYEPNRKRDLDNIAFAKKFILDALVKSGTIEGDGWSVVTGFTDDFFVDANNPHIEVDIEKGGR